MKFVTLDFGGLVRALLGQLPAKTTGDTAFIKIVIQVIRAAK